jgi:hypothetical protein
LLHGTWVTSDAVIAPLATVIWTWTLPYLVMIASPRTVCAAEEDCEPDSVLESVLVPEPVVEPEPVEEPESVLDPESVEELESVLDPVSASATTLAATEAEALVDVL